MERTGYRVEPLTPDRWDDFVTVLGRGGQGGCWCMYWAVSTPSDWFTVAKGGSQAATKDLFRALVDAGPPPGLLAYDGATPAAWCRVMARTRLPGLARSRYFKTDLAIDGVWSLSCFVVRTKHRGRGLTTVLTEAAVAFARGQGARILEVYPTDTAERRSPSALYTGLASTFTRLGFEEVQRTAPHKPMMRLALDRVAAG